MNLSPNMYGLRAKIIAGLGAMLLVVAILMVMAEALLARYSGAIERMFEEDYSSVYSCEELARSVDSIDNSIQLHFWQNMPLNKDQIASDMARCDRQLALQQSAATLQGEKQLTDQLASQWADLKQFDAHLLDENISRQDRQDEYGRMGFQKAVAVQLSARQLIDMNLRSMTSVRERLQRIVSQFRRALRFLAIAALILAAVFAGLIGRFFVRPIRALTESVHNIENGNLDVPVSVASRDELGTLASAISSMATQIKAYRQADHERLVRSEQTTQLAIDSLPDAVMVLNMDRRIELANETAKRLFKLTPGMHVDETDAGWLKSLSNPAKISDTGAAGGYESTVQVEDAGVTHVFLPRVAPIGSDREGKIGYTIVLADVTGLRRLDEMKNGLLSLVSHELKTPLTGLRMMLHLLAGGRVGTLTPKQQELLTTAREDSDRLHGIVESLLDMARIESGRALMELQPVSPQILADSAVGALGGAFESQHVELLVDIPPDIPYINADATRIRHVLINLLNNSLRFAKLGGHVKIWARAIDGQRVEMGVSDDGPGIPKTYLPRVFEKFFRVPGQPPGSGSGLGLSIAKDIVEAHGGHIRAESVEGGGATFAFVLSAVTQNAERKDGASVPVIPNQGSGV